MKRFSQRGMYNAVADINIIPLMDLVFNLLIVFMLTTPLLEQSIDIKLPPTSSGSPVEPKAVTIINLDAAGRIFVNEKLTDLHSLEQLAREDIRANPEQAFAIRADEKLAHGRFVEIVDHLKRAGVTRLGIVGASEK